jgi:hypothetical protein
VSYVKHYEGARKQDRRTPREFFAKLHAEYRFTLDGAATAKNALLPRFSSRRKHVIWGRERVFCNPPWSDIPRFIENAPLADLAVLLVPARVNARWFHRALALGAKPRYWQGKLSFGGPWNSPVDCLLLLFEHPDPTEFYEAGRNSPSKEGAMREKFEKWARNHHGLDFRSTVTADEWAAYSAGRQEGWEAGPAIAQLTLEIRNLAHRGWEDRPNAEFLFREIGKRAQKIAELATPSPGIATVDHELRSWSMDRSFSWREPHYKTAQELEGAFLAELAYESLGDKAIGRDRDTLRRSILIPMIRAEMRRRDRAKQVCDLVCTETTV